jgi:glycosyltransferase involved in cell wall biosynthesis
MDLPAELPSAELGPHWHGASPRLVTAGRLTAQKNHALLLRAFQRVLDRHPDAALVIIGEGELRPQLEALRDELGLSGRVSLPGFQLDPWPYLAQADLFVLSSDYEGFGLVLVEAMHAGLRVVSTDCEAGPAELLDGGRYGRLVPVGDEGALAPAMLEELKGPSDPERQRDRARSIAGSENLERYEELLAG